MELFGSIQYRGNKIYLNRKRMLESGAWAWAQESTGFEKGQEESARLLLAERNLRELAKHDLHAVVIHNVEREPTVRDYARRWIEMRKRREYTSAFDDERRFALHIYPYVVDGVVQLGELPLRRVAPRYIRGWLAAVEQKDLAPRTVRNLYSLLHAMFADAYADDLVDANPCRLRAGDLPRSDDHDPRWRRSAIFTRDEVVALMTDARIPIDRRTLYATAILTASRSGELSALRIGDYDPTAQPLGRLTIGESYSASLGRTKLTKTGTTRLVPVHPVLKQILDEWIAHGFSEVFGHDPRPTDLMFPSRPVGQRSVGIDYAEAQRRWPFCSRAELARRLGVSRAAVTQGLRFGGRRPRALALDVAYRPPKTSYRRLQEDLERLALRHRRLHDMKRTAVSLLTEDGARDPILTYLAWGPRKTVRDLYITLPWAVFCEEMMKLKLELPQTSCKSSCSDAAGT